MLVFGAHEQHSKVQKVKLNTPSEKNFKEKHKNIKKG